jgi:uncharacterized damage-inducible protein DinB
MLSLSLNDLLEYTDWERGKWYDCLRRGGDEALKISTGPHGDGRFETVGDLILHIFSAEERYAERLSGQPLSDPATIPNNNTEALFHFREKSRKGVEEFSRIQSGEAMGRPQGIGIPECKILNDSIAPENRHACRSARDSPLGPGFHAAEAEWHDG